MGPVWTRVLKKVPGGPGTATSVLSRVVGGQGRERGCWVQGHVRTRSRPLLGPLSLLGVPDPGCCPFGGSE